MAGGYPPHPNQGQPQGYGQPQPGYGQPQPGYGQQPQVNINVQGPMPGAPHGVDPKTGLPFSDKEKATVGFLQLLALIVGIGGIGRLVAGHTGVGVAQLVLSCTGIGQLWSIIDGILILVNGGTDGDGRPLRG
jgi:TM2 domain-containing membrane protein YozV